jgi:hypothetical protein
VKGEARSRACSTPLTTSRAKEREISGYLSGFLAPEITGYLSGILAPVITGYLSGILAPEIAGYRSGILLPHCNRLVRTVSKPKRSLCCLPIVVNRGHA